ncbi:MAG: galactokinase family protein [Armatimonadota bacterium]|nr:galactokinase family protein [Armatimonadota bacterium]
MQPIRYSAPGRAGVIGNPSDMYGGTVISCAIPLRARCTLEPSARLTFQSRERVLTPDTLETQSDEFDVCRAALRALGFAPESARFSLRLETDIPAQAGLAGSSALLTAIVACLLRYRNETPPTPHQLAEQVRRIEATELGVTCGYQDFYMAVFGGLNLMEFRDKELLGKDPTEPLATVEALGGYLQGAALPLWLATTGSKRFSGVVHANLRARWEAGEPVVVEGMARIGRLAREAKSALLAREWRHLAYLMNENYAIIRELGGSGEALDQLVQVALENGALGAKLAGAGGAGGTVIVLTLQPERTLPALREVAERIIPVAPHAPGLMAG